MNAVVERSENSQVTLKVEVEPERLAKATDQAYQRLVQRVTIPGFRKGKAPRKILERAVGVDALYREALDFVMPDAYREAVKETGIAPYMQPEFEVVELDPEKPLVFKATVPVQPTVKLGDYRSLRQEAPDLSISLSTRSDSYCSRARIFFCASSRLRRSARSSARFSYSPRLRASSSSSSGSWRSLISLTVTL